MLPATIRVYLDPSKCSEIANTREELELHAAAGYFPLPEERHLAANFEPPKPPEPPTDANGLRLDGPTLEEFEAAGYKADAYPPQGYASKPSPRLTAYQEEVEKAKAVPAPTPAVEPAPAAAGERIAATPEAPAPESQLAPAAPAQPSQAAPKPASKPKAAQG